MTGEASATVTPPTPRLLQVSLTIRCGATSKEARAFWEENQ
jgi:hypothetical protein